MKKFTSTFKRLGEVQLPVFAGVRVMMMPILIGRADSVPDSIGDWRPVLSGLFEKFPKHEGEIGYVTIDEKHLAAGQTHRRAGLHVDGVFQGGAGGWGGGSPGGPWASKSSGMVLVSSPAGCRAWNQKFEGEPGPEGECDHLRDQLKDEGTILEPGVAYWCGGLCVHESMPQRKRTKRQFLRLSLPSKAPWFEGYTENPLGVKPAGEILPRRPFMDYQDPSPILAGVPMS
jgi:hypothetical protein